MSTAECPFCPSGINSEHVILENEFCVFLRIRQPVLVGSGVIVPRAHRETVFDLSGDEVAATFRLLTQVKQLTDREYSPAGYNVGWNCGDVAGQEIFHAHLHVIPRFEDEPLAGRGMRFFLKRVDNMRPALKEDANARP